MHMNILTVRAVEADLQRKLRIAAAQRAIRTDGRRGPRLLAIRSDARWMRLQRGRTGPHPAADERAPESTPIPPSSRGMGAAR